MLVVSKSVLRSVCERVWLFVSFVSVWPCDGLATCPGCTPPSISPNDSWDRLQPPCDPTDGLSGYRKWMDLDGWNASLLKNIRNQIGQFL